MQWVALQKELEAMAFKDFAAKGMQKQVKSTDLLMALQQPVEQLPAAAGPAAACAAVSGGSDLSACRDEILEDDDVCRVVIDDVDDEHENDSPG